MGVVRQETPNPNALKFILPQRMFDKPLSFSSPALARSHPLAASLFELGTVYNVFMVRDFVTVNKLPHVSWTEVEGPVIEAIEQFLKAQ